MTPTEIHTVRGILASGVWHRSHVKAVAEFVCRRQITEQELRDITDAQPDNNDAQKGTYGELVRRVW